MLMLVQEAVFVKIGRNESVHDWAVVWFDIPVILFYRGVSLFLVEFLVKHGCLFGMSRIEAEKRGEKPKDRGRAKP